MQREEKKRITRERILQTALHLFAEKGYHDTTVAEITRQAGVAKGTFFNYFGTKEEVLLSVGSYQVVWLKNRFAEIAATPGEIGPRLIEAMVGLRERYPSTPGLVLALFQVTTTAGPSPQHPSSGLRMAEMLVPLFELGQQRGEFVTLYTPLQMASLWTQQYFGALLNWCMAPDVQALPDKLRMTFETLLYGISTARRQQK